MPRRNPHDVRPDPRRTHHDSREPDSDRDPPFPRDRFDRAYDHRAGFDPEPDGRAARREQSNREHAGREESTGHDDSATWDRPSRGLPPGFDRHYDTYETRPNPQGAYDEPDFLLNERGVYDEPGYSVDEPYEQGFDSTGARHNARDDARGYMQSGWGNEPRGQSIYDRAGYGPASEDQPVHRENPNAYRPAPYAPPPGERGGDPENQYGRVFGEQRPDLPHHPERRFARDDHRIRHEILERMRFDPTLDDDRIHVTVKGRHAVLRGVVDRPRDRAHAEEVANAVYGLRDVDNQLRVNRPLYRPGRR